MSENAVMEGQVQEVREQRKPGTFKPGADSRRLPGGRNNAKFAMRQASTRELVDDAIAAYRQILKDPTHKDYGSVARDVLNRNLGSPITEMQKLQQEALQAVSEPKNLSDSQLLSMLEEGETIEGDGAVTHTNGVELLEANDGAECSDNTQ